MKGQRVESIEQLWGDDGIDGGYCPVEVDGKRTWMVRTPNGHYGTLKNHEVTEHEDSTITVSPSILISDNTGELYHGFLTAGEWSE
jgi:hypothetical protein